MTRTGRLLALTTVSFAVFAALAWAASSPTVATGGATSVKQTTAVLNGTINPNGAATAYHFEYGLTPAYGASTTIGSLKAGTSVVSVTGQAVGLVPGTLYHYRLDASNGAGAVVGADRTLRTAGPPPPGVATGAGQTLGPTSVNVSGVINPQGAATAWYVQYGTSTTYTAQTPPATVPAGTAAVTVTQQLAPLPAGSTIHYRFVAVHGGSVPQYGADATVVTMPLPAPVPRITVNISTHHRRHRPVTVNVFGRVLGPSPSPSVQVCFNNVGVQIFRGRRRIAAVQVTLQPNCTYFAQLTLAPVRHGAVKLGVKTTFQGNGWLAPAVARLRKITIG